MGGYTMNNITKTEIKKKIREELQCPTDFIERCLNKGGRIDELKNTEHESDWQFVMNEIYDEWHDYCKAWELDPEEDNTGFKPQLFT